MAVAADDIFKPDMSCCDLPLYSLGSFNQVDRGPHHIGVVGIGISQQRQQYQGDDCQMQVDALRLEDIHFIYYSDKYSPNVISRIGLSNNNHLLTMFNSKIAASFF